MRVFLRLLCLLKPLRRFLPAAILLGAATIVASIGLLGSAAFLIAAAALHPSIAELQVSIVGVRFFGISRGIFRYFERLVSHDLSFRILAGIRVHFMIRLEKLAPAIFLRHRGGELLDDALSGIESLQNFFIRCLGPPLVGLLIGVGTSCFLCFFSSALALIFAGFYALSLLGLPYLAWRLAETEGKRSHHLKATLSEELVEMIQNSAEFKLAGAMETRVENWIRLSRRLSRIEEISALRDGLSTGMGLVVQHGAVLAVLVIGIPLVEQASLSGPVLAALALVTMAAFEGSAPLPQVARQLRHQLEAARKIFELLDHEPAVNEKPDARKPADGQKTSPWIRIEGVSFRYPEEKEPALDTINLEIPPGARLAITGPSGAGKSTLLHLLLRFYDPDTGRILSEDQDLRDLKLDGLRRNIGLLSQETRLFTGSVAENLLIARPGASLSELQEACRHAQIHTEIEALPSGYETWIGSAGLQLSGGQRRRLALARILLQDPKIFLLDEVTAHLDRHNAEILMKALFEHVGSRTLVHVTHRLNEMERYDLVLVMDRGQLVERGSHNELLERGGLYAQLRHDQSDFLDQGNVPM